MTGSPDQMLKIWDIDNYKPRIVASRDLQLVGPPCAGAKAIWVDSGLAPCLWGARALFMLPVSVPTRRSPRASEATLAVSRW